MEKKFIIGIDEVGRGALAGPVVVAALALPKKFKIDKKLLNLKLPKLKDSKKLSPRQREIWFKWIKEQKLNYVVASVPPKIIDKINISNAANLAATRSVKKLTKSYKLKAKNYRVYLDGGLYLKNLKPKTLHLKSKTIIKGDEKIPAISLASIVAKVHRDKLMKKLHEKYPRYDFINNVGYGVKKHIKAIKKFGFSKIHRKSFVLS
ncbi:ribonuclease HII [Candidatus Wolfebacteria bacterium]|nr:ribonuclease HII [Candidatus Wolfebacteria bacterium]